MDIATKPIAAPAAVAGPGLSGEFTGLPEWQARERLGEQGGNELKTSRHRSLARLANSLLLVLLAAAAIAALTGDALSFGIVAAVVVASVVLDLVQEQRAERTGARRATAGPLALLLPYLPLVRAFGFVPLPVLVLALVGGLTATYLVAAEVLKHWFYRPRSHRHAVRRPRPLARLR
jgi:hypothetical protein